MANMASRVNHTGVWQAQFHKTVKIQIIILQDKSIKFSCTQKYENNFTKEYTYIAQRILVIIENIQSTDLTHDCK